MLLKEECLTEVDPADVLAAVANGSNSNNLVEGGAGIFAGSNTNTGNNTIAAASQNPDTTTQNQAFNTTNSSLNIIIKFHRPTQVKENRPLQLILIRC